MHGFLPHGAAQDLAVDLSPERFYTRCVKCNGHDLDSLRQLFSHQSNLFPECEP